MNDIERRLLRILSASAEQLAAIDRVLENLVEARPEPPKLPAVPPAQPVTSPGPLLLGMGAGAKLLGVSRATFWRMINAGRLKKVEVLPGSFRVRRADVEALASPVADIHTAKGGVADIAPAGASELG